MKKDRAIRVQYGALPDRFTEAGSLELLLDTTRQTGAGSSPKGRPIKGLNPPKSAAQEAYEEAGIRGVIRAKLMGTFSYEKSLQESGGVVLCEVRVFPLNVKRQLKTWPEAHEQEARWFDSDRSIAVVKDTGLREVIASFIDRMTAEPGTWSGPRRCIETARAFEAGVDDPAAGARRPSVVWENPLSLLGGLYGRRSRRAAHSGFCLFSISDHNFSLIGDAMRAWMLET